MTKTIAVVGAGGVGAETLLRLKPTHHRIRVIDRDFIDEDTLKRQTLYRKADLGNLKADAAARKLGKRFEAVSEHLSEENAEALLKGADVVLDCTDNWATRALINQWALVNRTPWIFTSAIRSETMTTCLTPQTACFICWNPSAQTPRSCRAEGIRKATTATAGHTQVIELDALLAGKPSLAGKLQYTDVQAKTCTTTALLRNPNCPACMKKTFRLPKTKALTLCGSDEFLFQLEKPVLQKALASLKPERFGQVTKIAWKKRVLVVFPSGRILARGMDEKQARAAIDTLRQKSEA
ncbi:ThiF family adenylyltransferase [Candidatus Micrarchaeota archaeon]|nr:ThiF family adenylyltransferase [Candidatus Micrarchaeota archaeon]